MKNFTPRKEFPGILLRKTGRRKTMKWTVEREGALGEILVKAASDSSKTTVRSWISEGRITVEGCTVTDPRTVVKPLQTIALVKKREYLFSGAEILHKDSEILVVYKPAGLLSVPTETDLTANLLAHLKKHCRRRSIYAVHRLDREVSGVMVFAFSEQAQTRLKAQFEEHSILREYIAVVEGKPVSDRGTWKSYLLQEESYYYVRSVSDPARGRLAITHYETIATDDCTSVLRITLETGRKNQIRVHCSEAGCPILGDKKYGSRSEFANRVALQACKLGIVHPTSGKTLVFVRAPDPEFSPFLNGTA